MYLSENSVCKERSFIELGSVSCDRRDGAYQDLWADALHWKALIVWPCESQYVDVSYRTSAGALHIIAFPD